MIRYTAEKNVCPRIVNLLYYMYSNQLCHVKWGDESSASFSISNGVKQGGVVSPFLFSLYIDELFLVVFFSKKLPIVVVRDVCPSVRPSVVCRNIFFSR